MVSGHVEAHVTTKNGRAILKHDGIAPPHKPPALYIDLGLWAQIPKLLLPAQLSGHPSITAAPKVGQLISLPAPPTSPAQRTSVKALSPRASMAARHWLRSQAYRSPSALGSGRARHSRLSRACKVSSCEGSSDRVPAGKPGRAAAAQCNAPAGPHATAGGQRGLLQHAPRPVCKAERKHVQLSIPHLLKATRVLSWRSVGNAICSITTPTLHQAEEIEQKSGVWQTLSKPGRVAWHAVDALGGLHRLPRGRCTGRRGQVQQTSSAHTMQCGTHNAVRQQLSTDALVHFEAAGHVAAPQDH